MGKRSAHISLAEYIAAEVKEAESPLNTWGAGEEFNRPPDRNERWLHYIHSGRAAEMEDIHSDLNLWATGLRLGIDPMTLLPEEREKELQETFLLWQEPQKNTEAKEPPADSG